MIYGRLILVWFWKFAGPFQRANRLGFPFLIDSRFIDGCCVALKDFISKEELGYGLDIVDLQTRLLCREGRWKLLGKSRLLVL